MTALKLFNLTISLLFIICYCYQFLYIAIPFLKKEPAHKPSQRHRLAVMIAARNEEAIIGQLLQSLKDQTYPQELITVFLVADNCTDHTAAAATAAGAIVYERFNQTEIGKGYALQFLTEQMERDWGAFDGYVVIDADNILDEHYLEELNRSFSDGYQIVSSYVNSKNYGDNWVSAGYALWYIREARFLNYSRALLGISSGLSGSGFLFSRRILEKCHGWNFTMLIEDVQFTVHNVIAGERIGFNPNAIVYNEAPTKFGQSWTQRLRWTRGYLQVYKQYGWNLLKGAFHGSFSCFDMSMNIMPAFILSVASFLVNTTVAVVNLGSMADVMTILSSWASSLSAACLMLLFMGSIAVASEWKRISTSPAKKILSVITFPFYMLTYIPITCAALFCKVGWKPITHTQTKSLADIRRAPIKQRIALK